MTGASPTATGLSSLRDEVAGASSPKASTPSADEWRGALARCCGKILVAHQALEPFAEIDGEGDEDFPNETPVEVRFGRSIVYSLTLGDFRRARLAAQAIEAQRAETAKTGSAEDESAVGNADAPKE